jgi:hypothetical protein
MIVIINRHTDGLVALVATARHTTGPSSDSKPQKAKIISIDDEGITSLSSKKRVFGNNLLDYSEIFGLIGVVHAVDGDAGGGIIMDTEHNRYRMKKNNEDSNVAFLILNSF